jgi:hypothetical protein
MHNGDTEMTKAFQIGSTYSSRSACDYDTVFSFTVIGRTKKFITVTDRHGQTRRVGVSIWNDVEQAMPHGRYSMAAVISADRYSD